MAVTPYPSRYNAQPLDLTLSALADLNTAPNTAPYFTDIDQAALMTVSPLARSLLDDTTTAEMRATLEIPEGGGTPTGLPNTVAVFGGTGTLTADTDFIYNAATNRLGLGLTPAWTLDLTSSHSVGVTTAFFHTARIVQHLQITADDTSPKSYALQVESNFADNDYILTAANTAIGGVNVIARFTGSYNVETAIGVQATVEHTGAGSFQTGVAFNAAPPLNSGSGSLNYYVGFQAENSAVPNWYYGFYSGIANIAGQRWNAYLYGTAPNYFRGNVGIGSGKTQPVESLDTAGGIRLGAAAATNNGTLQWTGTDFQGRKAGAWVSLTEGGGGGPSFLLMGA